MIALKLLLYTCVAELQCQREVNDVKVVVVVDLVVVVASVIVLSIGSNGQVFATSAIRLATTGVLHITVTVHYCHTNIVFIMMSTLLMVLLHVVSAFLSVLTFLFLFYVIKFS